MKTLSLRTFLFLFCCFFSTLFADQVLQDVQKSPHVTAQIYSEDRQIAPSEIFWLLLKFDIEKDWHLYWKNPGDSGLAPIIKWTIPDGFQVKDIEWQTPERMEINGTLVFGYTNELYLLCPFQASSQLKIDTSYEIKASINWVACGSICIPESQDVSITLEAKKQSVPEESSALLFQKARSLMPQRLDTAIVETKKEVLQIILSFSQKLASDITSVTVFPEIQNLIDIHSGPSWIVEDEGKKLIVTEKLKNALQKEAFHDIRGIIVVNMASGAKKAFEFSCPITRALQSIVVPSVAKENPNQELEDLESRVWYRELENKMESVFDSEFFKIVFFAFIGGILLNVMPCVLPIISLKVFHLVQLKDQDWKTSALQGVVFSLGVILSFWVLAGALYLLQYLGRTVGWGFQLQEPFFVMALIIILLVLTLSLFGFFELGTGFAAQAASLQQNITHPSISVAHPSLLASFLSGVLATFVATPCTGPLLGSALGFAATLELKYSFLIFTSLGFGMAFPYLLLSLFPGLSFLLPRPGAWMVTFKKLMAFFMLATVLWLLWVLQAELSSLNLFRVLVLLTVISFAVWVYGTWGGLDRGHTVRMIGRVVALTILIAASFAFYVEVRLAKESEKINPQVVEKQGDWIPYSEEKLQSLLSSKTPVFLDFSAKWCLTCQANLLVIESQEVTKAFAKYGVVKMLADWTTGDEVITKKLRKLGRNGVPVYAVYGNDHWDDPIILPEVITPEIVIDALEKVSTKK